MKQKYYECGDCGFSCYFDSEEETEHDHKE